MFIKKLETKPLTGVPIFVTQKAESPFLSNDVNLVENKYEEEEKVENKDFKTN